MADSYHTRQAGVDDGGPHISFTPDSLSPAVPQTSPSRHSPSLSRSSSSSVGVFSGAGLSKSNSTASRRLSITSHISLRAIGDIPFGELRIHTDDDASDSEATETDLRDSGNDAAEPRSPQSCLKSGDIFRLIDLPPKFTVGLDYMAITTDDKVLGFRDIPRGPHFLWVQQPRALSRCGYWYITKEEAVVRVKQWDSYNEVLGDAASQFEVRTQKASIGTIYTQLMPYDLRHRPPNSVAPPTHLPSSLAREPGFENHPPSMWSQLTKAISEPFLRRVTGKRTADTWLVDSTDCVKGDSNITRNHNTASKAYKTVVGSELDFLFAQDVKDLRLLDSESPRQLAVDTSTRIMQQLNNDKAPVAQDDIIAELQFTFITGTHLGNAACLEQWWHLVLMIVLRAYRLCILRPYLCQNLLKTLHAQLVYTEEYVEPPQRDKAGGPGHFIAAGPSSERLIYQFAPQNRRKLRKALEQYKRRLDEILAPQGKKLAPEQKEVFSAFTALETWLWRHDWDLRADANDWDIGPDPAMEDSDDEQPMIVDLDENGREIGLVSFHHD